MRFRSFAHLTAAAAMLAAPAAAIAKSAQNLQDLVGARGSSGEGQLSARGFVYTDGHKGNGASYAYWWNAAKRDCVMVTTRDGRYATINDVSAADCNQQNHHGDGSSAAAAVAVGALIGAALLAHKSGNHDNGQHHSDQQAEADYERGYRDGLHGEDYHNYSRSDAYSSGYQNGVEQRHRETSHRDDHHSGAGYAPSADISDLAGARAAGADNDLRARGFRDVATVDTGPNSKGAIWWNGRTRQCVQVITVEGRVDSAVDIGQHPRCG
jgi:hypothetical protein